MYLARVAVGALHAHVRRHLDVLAIHPRLYANGVTGLHRDECSRDRGEGAAIAKHDPARRGRLRLDQHGVAGLPAPLELRRLHRTVLHHLLGVGEQATNGDPPVRACLPLEPFQQMRGEDAVLSVLRLVRALANATGVDNSPVGRLGGLPSDLRRNDREPLGLTLHLLGVRFLRRAALATVTEPHAAAVGYDNLCPTRLVA